jgi:hypothetical protein
MIVIIWIGERTTGMIYLVVLPALWVDLLFLVCQKALIIVKVAAEYGIRKVWQKTLFWDQLNPQWQDHNVVGTKTSFGDAQLGSSSIASISTES